MTTARTRPAPPATASPPRPRKRVLLSRIVAYAKGLILLGLAVGTLVVGLKRPALDDAREAFTRRDLPTSLRRALDDLGRNPSSRESALLAARSLSQQLYAKQAEPFYDRAGGLSSLPLEALRDRATGFFTSNEYDKAALACSQILEAHPNDVPTLRLLATLEFSRKRFDQGILAAERLTAIPEGHSDGLSLLAMSHHEANHPEHAVAASEALLKIDPELKTYRPGAPIFWLDFASDLIALQRYEEARTYLENVIGTHFEPYLLDVLGLALSKLGEDDAAEAKWRESIRRDPAMLNPWLQLGRLYNSQKKFAEAAKVLERAVSIEDNNIDSHYQLSTSYKFLGRAEESKLHADRAEALRQKSPAQGGM